MDSHVKHSFCFHAQEARSRILAVFGTFCLFLSGNFFQFLIAFVLFCYRINHTDYTDCSVLTLPHLHPEYENGCALRHMAPSDAACHGDRQGSPHFAALPSVKLECSQGIRIMSSRHSAWISVPSWSYLSVSRCPLIFSLLIRENLAFLFFLKSASCRGDYV